MSPSNLYDYKGLKSGNEETGFFNTKGRISRGAFFKRLALVFLVYLCSSTALKIDLYLVLGVRFYLFFETLHSYFLPLGLLAFLFIQGAKRMHDINRSGWIFFVPFYNIYLSTLPGVIGNNNYGIDPKPGKNITYFDELEKEGSSQIPNVESKPTLGQGAFERFFASSKGLYLLASVLALGILMLINLPSDSIDSSVNDNDSIINVNESGLVNEKKRTKPAPQDTTPQPLVELPVSVSAPSDTPNKNPNPEESKKTNPQKNERSSPSNIIDNFERITVGKQVWMKGNLSVETFRNGETIPHAATMDAWTQAAENGVPAWCYYDNDPKRGKLYNWFAVNDPRGLAPKGWHIPSDSEWGQLITTLGGPYEASQTLKQDEGFDAKLSGFRNPNGKFEGKGTAGRWWSTSSNNSSGALGIRLRLINQIFREEFVKGHGFSIRVIKD